MRKALALAVSASLGVSVAASVAASGGGAPQARATTPTFKTSINAVLLDVRVVDGDGAFVPGLRPDDFRVVEDGVEQAVTTFEQVDLPITGPERKPTFGGRVVDPDVASNDDSNGRLYVMVLDDLNMHPLRTPTARALAREFIEKHLAANDRMVLTTTSGRKDLSLEFTNDRAGLLAAVDRFEAGYGLDRREQMSNSAHNALLSLSADAKWMATIDGRRKSIIFISEGFDGNAPDAWAQWDPLDQFPGFESARPGVPSARATADGLDFGEIAEAAARSNVTIYGIDPIGRPGAAAPGVKPTPWLIDDNITSTEGYTRVWNSRAELSALSEVTGGFATVNSNDFSGTFNRIVHEASSYYLIGYVSTNAARDGKFRHVGVRTTRPGMTIHTRSGYSAQKDPNTKADARSTVPKGWTSDLLAAIQSPVQIAGLTMSVGAAAFRGAGGNASVEVVVETRRDAVRFDAAGDRSQGAVGLALVVADADGHVKASHHGDLDMHLEARTREAVDALGVRLLTRLTLKPGHYIMRVGTADAVGTSKGSVHYVLDVPDFSKPSLAMSGLALESREEARRPTSGADSDWRARFDAPPTATRRFAAADEVTVVDEIYNNGAKSAPIDVVTRVQSEAGDVVFSAEETVTGDTKYPRRTTIGLAEIKPGNYLLTVEARNRADRKASASRQVVFSVVE